MSKFKWDNDMKSVSMKNKQKEIDAGRKLRTNKDFEYQLTVDMQQSQILNGMETEVSNVGIQPDDSNISPRTHAFED